MAKAEVLHPLNMKILDRRKSSVTEHINRIRSAYFKLPFHPWWKTLSQHSSSSDSKKERTQKTASMHDIRNDYDFEDASGSESVEDFHLKELSYENLKTSPPISRNKNISLDSVKGIKSYEKIPANKSSKATTRKQPALDEKIPAKKSSKIFIQKQSALDGKIPAKKSSKTTIPKQPALDKEIPAKKSNKTAIKKKNEKKSKKKTTKKNLKTISKLSKTKQKSKAPVSKLLSRNATKKQMQGKEVPLQENSIQDSHNDIKQTANDPQMLTDFEPSKEEVQKWLHDLQFPQIEKPNIEDEQIVDDTEQFGITKTSLSSKDIIVLKWLHDLQCPQMKKINDEANESFLVERKRSPVHIIKKPLDSKAIKQTSDISSVRKSLKNKNPENKNVKSIKMKKSSSSEINIKSQESKHKLQESDKTKKILSSESDIKSQESKHKLHDSAKMKKQIEERSEVKEENDKEALSGSNSERNEITESKLQPSTSNEKFPQVKKINDEANESFLMERERSPVHITKKPLDSKAIKQTSDISSVRKSLKNKNVKSIEMKKSSSSEMDIKSQESKQKLQESDKTKKILSSESDIKSQESKHKLHEPAKMKKKIKEKPEVKEENDKEALSGSNSERNEITESKLQPSTSNEKSPQMKKINDEANESFLVDRKRSPVHVIKEPLDSKAIKQTSDISSVRKSLKNRNPENKNVKSIKMKKSSSSEMDIKSQESKQKLQESDKTKKILSSESDIKSQESKHKLHESAKMRKQIEERPEVKEENDKEALTGSNSERKEITESKLQPSTSNESSEVLKDVEMFVSELGKLQIVLNLKSLTPDVAAVIVWMDDIPKSFLHPDYEKPLSTRSLILDVASSKGSQASIKSISLSQLEDIASRKSISFSHLEDAASSKPNIFFPSCTVLKNIAVSSKVGLGSFNEGASNSVMYKRCNLNHIEEQ